MSERGSYRSTREFEGFGLFLSCGNKRAMHAYLCRSSCFFVRAGPGAPDARLVVLRRLSININIVIIINNNNNNNIKRQGRNRTCHYFLGCVRPLITLRTHASPPKPLQHLRITSIFITYPPPARARMLLLFPLVADAALAALSQSTKWVEKRTADDVPYYFEPSSETVTWEKPDCLKSPEELQSNSGPWAWVRQGRGQETGEGEEEGGGRGSVKGWDVSSFCRSFVICVHTHNTCSCPQAAAEHQQTVGLGGETGGTAERRRGEGMDGLSLLRGHLGHRRSLIRVTNGAIFRPFVASTAALTSPQPPTCGAPNNPPL